MGNTAAHVKATPMGDGAGSLCPLLFPTPVFSEFLENEKHRLFRKERGAGCGDCDSR